MKNIAHRFCPLSLTISFESLSGSMVNSEFSFCIVDPLKFYPPGSIHSTPDSSMRSVLANIQFPDFETTYEDRQEQTVKGPSHPDHNLLLHSHRESPAPVLLGNSFLLRFISHWCFFYSQNAQLGSA